MPTVNQSTNMVTVYMNTDPETQINPEPPATSSERPATPPGRPATPSGRPATPSEPLPSNIINASTSKPDLDVQVPEKVILVMGVTGAGKSRFIRTTTGDSSVIVGDTLRSSRSSAQSYSA